MMLHRMARNVIRNKRVLLRVDFNVPILRGQVQDDFKIRSLLPTIRALLRHKNCIVILSHHSDWRQTLKPVAGFLGRMIKEKVFFARDTRAVSGTGRRVIFLENLRFFNGETRARPYFARRLAKLGDVFVNDAFGVAHRREASSIILPRLMPSYLGLRFEKEIRQLDRALKNPRRPLAAIIGGAKVKTKANLIKRFIRVADNILVGGAGANAILRARGVKVGRPKTEGREAFSKKTARSKKLILPVDAIAASGGRVSKPKIFSFDEISPKDVIYDIGPKTRFLFAGALKKARSVIWNGPMGLVESKAFAGGTEFLARLLARHSGFVLIGGGDTIAFIDKIGLLSKFKRISSGGGAMLAYLAGEKLPALEALKRSRFQ